MGDYFFGEEVMGSFSEGSRLFGGWFPPCGRAYFLLLRQKKVAKEKATPGSAPATRVPCATRQSGRLAKLACGSDNASRQPPDRLRCSAPLMGTRETSRNEGSAPEELSSIFCRQPLEKAKTRIRRFSQDALPGPLGGAEQRRKAGGSRRGLFEGQSPEFRSHPAF